MSEPAVRIEELKKNYRRAEGVQKLSFSVKHGEVYGLLGPNGAGKTTTIETIMDFIRPSAGEISVLEHDPHSNVIDVHQRIGYVSDEDILMPTLTGRECLQFQIRMKQGSESPDELLDLVGLEAARDRQTSQYSTGMKQRLEMAIAIVDEPELLVLDEPFTGLDPHGVKLVREIIEHENERGATVLISSHQLDQVGQLCDRVGILSDGNLVTSGTIDELCAESSLTAKIRVVLSDAPENVTLDGVHGIHEVIDRGSELHVTVDSGTRKESVVEAVRNKKHRVTSVTIERPSMEELFVDLTQREDTSRRSRSTGDAETKTVE